MKSDHCADHCKHVAAFYWHRYCTMGSDARKRNAFYHQSNNYTQAADGGRWFG